MRKDKRAIANWALLLGTTLCFGLLLAANGYVEAQTPGVGKVAPTPPQWKGPNGPIDLKIKDPALEGALDLHAHLDPDMSGGVQLPRAVDAIDYARSAKERG